MPADREQDLVLEGIVHDLNNVFQTILESVEVLAADEKWTSLARALRRSASRGQRIVTGLHESAPAVLELEAIVEDAVQFASDVLRVLRRHGFVFFGQRGCHQKWRHPDGRQVIVPMHGSKPIPIGTLKHFIKGSGVDVGAFLR